MLPPLTHDTLDDHLASFADGELDPAQTLAMWAFLETHPDRAAALRRVQDHRRLTAAAKRSLGASAPSDVRDRIAALLEAGGVDAAPDRKAAVAPTATPSTPWRRRARYLLAAAAGLLIGVSAAAIVLRPTQPRPILPAAWVAKVGRVHAECSRLPEALHDATFESVDAALASTMKASLGGATAAPDLAAAGFRFVGAGPCEGAGVETVHLLYRSANPRSVAAISLFVQPDAGQFPALAANRVYRVSSPTSPFPALAWRKDNVICVLLADGEKTESIVLQLIRPTAADEIVTMAAR